MELFKSLGNNNQKVGSNKYPLGMLSPIIPVSSVFSTNVPGPLSPIIPFSLISSPVFEPLSPLLTPLEPMDIELLSPVIPSIYVLPDTIKVPRVLVGDVCDIENIKDKISKLIYYKLLDKWLYDDLIDVLGYLKISGDKVEIIKNIDDKTHPNKESDKDLEKKIEYIENKMISRDDVYVILKKFVSKTNISWCEVHKNDYFVMKTMGKYLTNKFEERITGK